MRKRKNELVFEPVTLENKEYELDYFLCSILREIRKYMTDAIHFIQIKLPQSTPRNFVVKIKPKGD